MSSEKAKVREECDRSLICADTMTTLGYRISNFFLDSSKIYLPMMKVVWRWAIPFLLIP